MKNEGLKCGRTTKGKKEGTSQTSFLVGIGYSKGVVLFEPLTNRMSSTYYTSTVRRTFRAALKKTLSSKAKRILVNGDPLQNSKLSKQAIARIGGKAFTIRTRSPDINPIENLFNQVRGKLKKQAHEQKITTETREKFSNRVQNLPESFSIEAIDKIIESMPRIDMTLKRHGQRIKY